MNVFGLLNARDLAKAIGMPFTWIKAESDAGRIPFLPVGNRKLYEIDAVKHVLRKRAWGKWSTDNQGDDGANQPVHSDQCA